MENRIAYFNNRNDVEFCEVFDTIENNNAELYNFLMAELRSNQNSGVRKDVLCAVSEHITDFDTDKNILHTLSGFMVESKIYPDYLLWINFFLKKNSSYPVDDFDITIHEALESDVPFEKVKELFESGKYDEVEILYKIQEYSSEDSSDSVSFDASSNSYAVSSNAENVTDSSSIKTDEHVEKFDGVPVNKPEGSYNSYNQTQTSKPAVSDNPSSESYSSDKNYVDMINSLITVMSPKNSDGASRSIEDNLREITAKFQLATTELQSFSAEIVGILNQKDEEIKRQNGIISIQKQLIINHQNKLNELRIEIAKLNEKILRAEKTEMKSEAINQKIKELQSLTYGASRIGADDLY